MSYHELKKGRFSELGRLYFVTATTAHRIPHFHDFFIARLLVDVMKDQTKNKEADFLAWVIMPDHAHWLLRVKERASLSMVMNNLKGRSARIINQKLSSKQNFWQANFYDHALRSDVCIKSVARYIIANPLRANLVDNIGDYPHWDAIWI